LLSRLLVVERTSVNETTWHTRYALTSASLIFDLAAMSGDATLLVHACSNGGVCGYAYDAAASTYKQIWAIPPQPLLSLDVVVVKGGLVVTAFNDEQVSLEYPCNHSPTNYLHSSVRRQSRTPSAVSTKPPASSCGSTTRWSAMVRLVNLFKW
jgi:hypothetical protein